MSASAEPDTGKESLMEDWEKDLFKTEETLHDKFAAYIQALTGFTEPTSLVWMEHSYARAWRATPGAGAAAGGAPRTLLVRRAPRCPDCHGDTADCNVVDVETVEKEVEPPLPIEESPPLEKPLGDEDMNEESGEEVDWEEKLESLAPSVTHKRLVMEVIDCIRGLRMSRLAGAPRSAVPFARRLRHILAQYWHYTASSTQQKPVMWMHAVLAAYLPRPFLLCYNDMLSVLKTKIPSLLDRMGAGHVQPANLNPALPPLPGQPPPDPSTLLLWVPSGRDAKDNRWTERIKAVWPVHRVPAAQGMSGEVGSVCVSLVCAARARAAALLAEQPRARLVLAGHGAGAALAIQVAMSIQCNSSSGGIGGLILLAPPLLTADGPRGAPDDCIYDLLCPILFVVGQNAMQCTVQDAEEIRCKLRRWSRLVIVGAADDQLRLAATKLRSERATQEMVECALAEEIGAFIRNAQQCKEVPQHTNSSDFPPAADTSEEIRSSSSSRRRNAPLSPPHFSHKRPRHSTEQSTTPIKGRGVALYRLNNPPPEGATLSMGQILTPKGDEDIILSGTTTSPSKLNTDTSCIQITNSKLRKTVGDKRFSDVSNNIGIKVLENVCVVSGRVAMRGTGTGALTLPPKRTQQQQLTVANSQITTSPITTSLNSTNIMDIPIIFADDNKQIGGEDCQGTELTTPKPDTDKALVATFTAGSTQNHTISVKRSDLSSPLKYTKVILAKRPGSNNALCGTEVGTGRVLGRPIIVKGKGGPLTAFKVIPGTMLHRGTAQQLIIKRSINVTDENKRTKSDADVEIVEEKKIETLAGGAVEMPELKENEETEVLKATEVVADVGQTSDAKVEM